MNNKKRVLLTLPQVGAVLSRQKMKYFEWGRGSGKSFILAYFIWKMVTEMPRAAFALVGVTYSQILATTLPSTLKALEILGLIQDVDFVVGKSGKKFGFELPFETPNQWNCVIHFSNGAVLHLVSLDGGNSRRGLNTFGFIADEAALLNPEKLYYDVQLTNRAKYENNPNASMLGAEVYASSTPLTKKGKWFIEKEKLAKSKPNEYYFSKASSLSNPNLREDYLVKARDNAPSLMLFEAEFLNKRPKEITDGFYANLNPDIHYYTDYDVSYLEKQIWIPEGITLDCRQDKDLHRKQPLIVSLDFGVFNSLTVSQFNRNTNTFRVLKSMWAKSPKITNDLFIDQFLPYYEAHQDKKIYLYGGHDGHNAQANSTTTLYEQLENLLRQHGWKVYVQAKKSAPLHSRKYLLLNAMLKETDHRLPKIRIHQENCADLITALERAEAIEGKNGIEKQKKDERNKSMLQQHTTHLTDAFDYPIYDMFWDLYDNGSSTAGEGLIMLI